MEWFLFTNLIQKTRSITNKLLEFYIVKPAKFCHSTNKLDQWTQDEVLQISTFRIQII